MGTKTMIKVLWVLLITLSLLFAFSCGDDDDDDDNGSSDDDDDDDDDNDDDNDDDDNDTVDPLELVNPFIGTGGLGFGAGSLVPGPQWPNGMVRPSPDTGLGVFAPRFQHFAGYWYADTHIRGFSQTRVVGTGAIDQGNIRLMPIFGISNQLVKDTGYVSPFSKESEEASVGYYKVTLDATDIDVELSSTQRSTIHRYAYPDSQEDPYVILDVTAYISMDEGDCHDANVTVDVTNNEVYGYMDMHGGFSGRYGGLPVYFVAQFSETFTDYGTFKDDVISSQNTYDEGTDLGAYVGFSSAKGSELVVKIGISYISVEKARENLEGEITDFDFDAVVDANRSAWEEKLGLIDIKGGSEEQKIIFYSALYHAYMMPTLFTEAGGKYIGFDDAVHDVDGFTYYTDMSIWDTFRTLHPLMTLVDPDRSRDFVVSLIKMYEQGGSLPRWPHGKGYTGCMIGTHADSVITEAYIKGITDFDVDTAYQGMYEHATGPVPDAGRSDFEHYTTIGYCAIDFLSRAPSKSIEYSYDDYCVGRLAQELGHTDDATMFMERSGYYANLWDPNTEFIRARYADGSWYEPFMPQWPFANEYVEGDAWQWSWFVPHDVPGLISLFPDTQAYLDKLTYFFQRASEQADHFLPDIYYWHGNEPDIQASYMFNEAGRPDLTQKWVRWVMEAKYKNDPAGIDGNDDGGTLSSWYVFSALGFFPLNPCDGRYMVGSPVFDEMTLHLPGGDLKITAENNSEVNKYIQSLTLNGESLEDPWFDHDDIVNGGTLHFVMGPNPSTWGTK